jgi:hypothetical protein
VVSLNKSAALRRECAGGVSAKPLGTDYSVGRLVRVLDTSIALPPRGGPQTVSSLGSGTPLVESWRAAGFEYSAEEAAAVCQVLVEFPRHRSVSAAQDAAGDNAQYAYPADKVFRTRAPIIPPPEEIEWINRSLAPDWVPPAVPQQAGYVREVTVRDGFVASPGYVLLAADYSQVELRILAHFSADSDLSRAFEAGEDVFRAMAGRWLRKAEAAVSPAERNQVKQICYALIYGAGPALVAEQAGVSVEAAQQMMKDFLRTFPGVQKFLLRTKKQCRQAGFVQTLLGRRRYLPDIASEDKKKRAKAERQAVNTLCQGSAADLIKVGWLVAYIMPAHPGF